MQPQVDLEPDELAVIVRDEIEQVQISWRNALRHAMAAGDALNALQPKIAELGINWKKWLKENCFVSDRTAQLYQQLARHRDEIESQLQQGVELSLRAARKLISGPKPGDEGEDAGQVGGQENEDETENPPEPESLIEHWRRSPDELTTLLDAVGVAGILEAMSAQFGRQLRARLPAPKRKPKPFKHTLNLKAHSAHNGRGKHSRHEVGKAGPR
jgi:hypothetical protein